MFYYENCFPNWELGGERQFYALSWKYWFIYLIYIYNLEKPAHFPLCAWKLLLLNSEILLRAFYIFQLTAGDNSTNCFATIRHFLAAFSVLF